MRSPVEKDELAHCDKCEIPLSPAELCHRQDHGRDTPTTLWCPCCGEFFEGCTKTQLRRAHRLEKFFQQPGVNDYQQALALWLEYREKKPRDCPGQVMLEI